MRLAGSIYKRGLDRMRKGCSDCVWLGYCFYNFNGWYSSQFWNALSLQIVALMHSSTCLLNTVAGHCIYTWCGSCLLNLLGMTHEASKFSLGSISDTPPRWNDKVYAHWGNYGTWCVSFTLEFKCLAQPETHFAQAFYVPLSNNRITTAHMVFFFFSFLFFFRFAAPFFCDYAVAVFLGGSITIAQLGRRARYEVWNDFLVLRLVFFMFYYACILFFAYALLTFFVLGLRRCNLMQFHLGVWIPKEKNHFLKIS